MNSVRKKKVPLLIEFLVGITPKIQLKETVMTSVLYKNSEELK